MALSMDVSASFLKFELASTIDQAVRCAVETVLKETARVVGVKLAAARNAAEESHRENQSLRERLEVSESELKAVRYYMSAAEKNIKQCLLLNRTQPEPSTDHPAEDQHTGTSSRKTFHNSPVRIQNSKTVPSVGLCLPTVQPDWPRVCLSRRRQRGSSFTAEQSHLTAVQTSPAPTSASFYVTNEVQTEKEDFSAVSRPEMAYDKQGDLGSSTNTAEDFSSMVKYEFEMNTHARSINELEFVEGTEDIKLRTIKIEEDPDSHTLESVPSESVVACSSSFLQNTTQITPPSVPESEGEALLSSVPSAGSNAALSRTVESPDKVHRCNICGRGFRRFYCLKTHQRIHTGERPYPCRYCEKRFRHLDSLHKHQRIHTGERPYRCAECGCCFRELGQLKKHRLKHSPTFVSVAQSAFPVIPARPSFAWPNVNAQPLE